jgi:hypothetical protein
MLFYTYLHRRASDNLPFYIGKGKGCRVNSRKNRSPYWHHVADKHGLKTEVVASWPTEAEAFEHEKFLIWCFRDMGFGLVNLSDGGEGQSGWVPSKETKGRISAAKKGKPSPRRGVPLAESARLKMIESKRGKTLTAEHKAKISAAGKGVAKSAEHKAQISQSSKGRIVSNETRKKISEAHKRRHQTNN